MVHWLDQHGPHEAPVDSADDTPRPAHLRRRFLLLRADRACYFRGAADSDLACWHFRPLTISPANSKLILIALTASLILAPLWTRCTFKAREVVPLSAARGWAHALAIWDYLRGKTMAWQASGAQVSSVRRFHVATTVWNGSAAISWLALAAWRTIDYRSWQYVVAITLGLFYAASTVRLLSPPRKVS